MRKKMYIVLMIAIMSVTLLASCGKSNNSDSAQANTNETVEAELPAEGGSVYETPDSDDTGMPNVGALLGGIGDAITDEYVEKAIIADCGRSESPVVVFNDLNQAKYACTMVTPNEAEEPTVLFSKINTDNLHEESLDDGTTNTVINMVDIKTGTSWTIEFSETANGEIGQFIVNGSALGEGGIVLESSDGLDMVRNLLMNYNVQ